MANLALIEKLFELDDHKFRVVTIEDEPWWFVSDVEEYLGYTSGSLRSIIRGDWEKELGDGVDFRVLEGQDLESFRQIASDLKSVSNMTRRVMLLSESGIHAVTLLSRKPKGRKLRRFLADEVLPSLRKTGSYGAADNVHLSPQLAMLQGLLDQAIAQERRVAAVEIAQKEIKEEQDNLDEKQSLSDVRVRQLENKASLLPGEMTALQLAGHVRWETLNGNAHNLAVILAATNAGFVGRSLLRTIPVKGPSGIYVDEHVLSASGVVEFETKINSQYCTGQQFAIEPNEIARIHGYKCKRNVVKA